jgi:hypothetical protein
VLRRRLLFHGEALKFSRKRTQERYFILFSDVFIVAALGAFGSLKVNKQFPSGAYLVMDVADCPPFEHAVDVRQRSKSFRANLKVESAKQALLEGFEEMKKIAGFEEQELENQGFAPVWIPDSQAPNCMWCGAKFSLTNRRHHCRSCGDCICKSCFRFKCAIPGLGGGEQSVCQKCFTRITRRETLPAERSPPTAERSPLQPGGFESD